MKASHLLQTDVSIISRRDLLKGIGVGAAGASLGLGLNILPVIAQSPEAATTAVAFYRFQVGELELTIIEDGAIGFPPPFLAVNAPEEDVSALMQAHGLSTEFAPLSVGIVLVRSGERLVLMDTGSGTSAFNKEFFGENIGNLVPTLELIGVTPEDITDVIFSHYHPDHLGGTSADDRPVFPNAQHYLPQADWDFLQSGVTDEFLAPVVEFANRQLQPLVANDGQLAFYDDEDELVPGVGLITRDGDAYRYLPTG